MAPVLPQDLATMALQFEEVPPDLLDAVAEVMPPSCLTLQFVDVEGDIDLQHLASALPHLRRLDVLRNRELAWCDFVQYYRALQRHAAAASQGGADAAAGGAAAAAAAAAAPSAAMASARPALQHLRVISLFFEASTSMRESMGYMWWIPAELGFPEGLTFNLDAADREPSGGPGWPVEEEEDFPFGEDAED